MSQDQKINILNDLADDILRAKRKRKLKESVGEFKRTPVSRTDSSDPTLPKRQDGHPPLMGRQISPHSPSAGESNKDVHFRIAKEDLLRCLNAIKNAMGPPARTLDRIEEEYGPLTESYEDLGELGEFVAQNVGGSLNWFLQIPTTNPVADYILVSASSLGIAFMASDVCLAVKSSCAAEISREGSIAVPGKYFIEIVDRCPYDHIDFSSSNGTVEIVSNAYKRTCKGRSAKLFPNFVQDTGSQEITVNGDLLRKVMRSTLHCTTHERSRFILDGSYWQIHGDTADIYATDGRVLSFMSIECRSSTSFSAFIPAKTMRYLLSILPTEESITLAFGHERIMCETGAALISSNLFSGKLVPYEEITRSFLRKDCTTVYIPRENFQGGLRRLSHFSNGEEPVLLFFRKNLVVMTCGNYELYGVGAEGIDIEYEGKDFCMRFDMKYLTGLLDGVDWTGFLFKIAKDLGSVVICSSCPTECTYVLLPMRDPSEMERSRHE